MATAGDERVRNLHSACDRAVMETVRPSAPEICDCGCGSVVCQPGAPGYSKDGLFKYAGRCVREKFGEVRAEWVGYLSWPPVGGEGEGEEENSKFEARNSKQGPKFEIGMTETLEESEATTMTPKGVPGTRMSAEELRAKKKEYMQSWHARKRAEKAGGGIGPVGQKGTEGTEKAGPNPIPSTIPRTRTSGLTTPARGPRYEALEEEGGGAAAAAAVGLKIKGAEAVVEKLIAALAAEEEAIKAAMGRADGLRIAIRTIRELAA